jgi:hypothetical protein
MNYKIIADEEKLQEFIEWLPELQPSEKFYVSLMCRNKYLEDKTLLKGDKVSLKRFVTKKEYLFDKLKQLEVELGAYKQFGVAVPQAAICTYITVNPICIEKAAKQMLVKLAQLITHPFNGYDINQLSLSECQKAKSRQLYYSIDFDKVSVDEIIPQLENKINLDCLKIIQTHGGLHVLIEFAKLDKKFEKSWYKSLSSIHGADLTDTALEPIVGCWQGGFIPKFIKL